jgi:hypothetical protein
MKKRFLFTVLLSMMMQLIITFQSTAQVLPGIHITYASDSDSSNYYCSAPTTIYFYVYGTASGYVTGDSTEIKINYGDGTDTTFKTPIYTGQTYFYGTSQHVYNAPGNYSCQYIATGPDGSSDTLVVNNEVFISNTCGAISGQVYLDENGNCIFDTGDIPLQYYSVTVSNGSQQIAYAWTDSMGYYSVNVPIGPTYTVAAYSNYYYGQSFDITCPASGSYTVSSIPSANLDFGLSCLEGYDLTGYLSGWGFRPGFDATVWFDVWNMRCMPVNGQAKLVLDPTLTFVNSYPAPDAISGDTLIYNFNSVLNGYWNYPYFDVIVHTPVTANIGDSVCMQLIIDPIAGDSVPSNNIIYACYPVQNSWDPNMKSVSPAGEGPEGDIPNNTAMTYTVDFQNTGTAVAYNIIVIDTLDSDLNAASMEIVGSSHPMTFNMMPGNIMKFTFNNIMLPDSGADEQGSHGYVIYRVNQKTDLPLGTKIKNTADIYFDFNPAIITNTTLNTVDYLTGIASSEKPEVKVSVYPNPSNKLLNVSVPGVSNISAIRIFNTNGNVVYSRKNISGNNLSLNTSGVSAGTYYVSVVIGSYTYTTQMVIVH